MSGGDLGHDVAGLAGREERLARGDTLLSSSPNTSRSIAPALRTTPGRTIETPI